MGAGRNEHGEYLIDTSKPDVARVYDAILGGKDNYAADRDEACRILQAVPDAADLARVNRAFLAKAVTWAANHGVTSFLDLGCGFPYAPLIHQTARAAAPQADIKVVYLDRDPVVVSHVSALASGNGAVAVRADLTCPDAVLAGPAREPVAGVLAGRCLVILGLVLHWLDAAQAGEVVADWAGRLVPGSYVAVTAGWCPDPVQAADLAVAVTADRWRNRGPATMDRIMAAAGLRLLRARAANVECWPFMPSKDGSAAQIVGGIGIRD